MSRIRSGRSGRLYFVLIGSVFALLGSTASAQSSSSDAKPDPYMLPHTEIHTLHSTAVGDGFVISIALPFSYGATEQTYPVLFAPDADLGFAMATQIARLMQLRQELPDFVLVGIGYKNFRSAMVKRDRDLTPTHIPSEERCSTGIIKCGGAASFLQFIRTELMPFVESNYRVDIENNAYMGFSLGGLFGLYTLLHEPDTFKRYLIGSPSIWWQEGVTFSYEDAYAAEHTDLAARVFMSVGSLETEGMVEDMNMMTERLLSRAYPNLILERMVFEGETHSSVPAAAASRGMRVLFGARMNK